MKKKVLFVAYNMAIGGIHTALINFLQVMDEKCADQYEVDLFTFGKGALMPQIPKSVRVVCGNELLELSAYSFYDVLQSKNLWNIFLRCLMMIYVRIVGSDRFYRAMFKQHRFDEEYDHAISFFNDVPRNYFNRGTNLYVSDFVKAKEKIAWIHTDPIKMHFDAQECRKTYRDFDQIFCVSQAVKQKFDQLLPEYAFKTKVVYNQFSEKRILSQSLEYIPFRKDKDYCIVTVGRVDNSSKRIDGIVRVCARLRNEGISGFRWYIVGNGPDLPSNQLLAQELGVSELIFFEGEKTNPFPYIKHADLFALYSAFEGFPMVIGEAQALETFILTTNYAAAREQITEKQGIIAETDEEFYQELKRLILCRN